jgi:dihydroflavonol-4-reductase
VRFLVTGATGFVGRHLVGALEGAGHQVVGLSRSGGRDILDQAGLREAADGCDGAFHCAGKVSRRPEDAAELYRVHVEGTKALLDACAGARVKRVVIVSTSGTCAVSETGDRAGTEDDPAPIGIIGQWPYYRAKLFAERAALERNGSDVEVVSINPSLVLGPGDVNGSSTEDVRRIIEGSVPFVPVGGVSFVDVRDTADALLRAMERGRAGQRYLIGACNLTVREFFGRVARIAGVEPPWIALPRSRELSRAGEYLVERFAARVGFTPPADVTSIDMAQCFWYVDASKAERELGWRARDPNATLQDTVDDLRARGVVWPRPTAGRTVAGTTSAR